MLGARSTKRDTQIITDLTKLDDKCKKYDVGVVKY